MTNKDKKVIQTYLDGAIRKWRFQRDNALSEIEEIMAICYVDAFQSVRISLLGSSLEPGG
jgi:hypothetical protein